MDNSFFIITENRRKRLRFVVGAETFAKHNVRLRADTNTTKKAERRKQNEL